MYFQYIKSSYISDRIKFESKISSLEHSVAKEKGLREEGDAKAETIFKHYQEHMKNSDYKVAELEKQNDKLKSVGNDLAREHVSKIPAAYTSIS